MSQAKNFSFTPPPSAAHQGEAAGHHSVLSVASGGGRAAAHVSPAGSKHRTGTTLNQLFTPQGNKPLEALKTQGVVGKEYDKESKSQVVVLEHSTLGSKIALTGAAGGSTEFLSGGGSGGTTNLIISHPIIAVQLQVLGAGTVTIEVCIADSVGRKRLMFSSGFNQVIVDPLHTKFPLTNLPRNQWLTLCFDVQEIYTNTFGFSAHGGQLSCVTGFSVSAVGRVRKIFSMQDWPGDPSLPNSLCFPSSVGFPSGVSTANVVILKGTELGAAPRTAAAAQGVVDTAGRIGGKGTPQGLPKSAASATPKSSLSNHNRTPTVVGSGGRTTTTASALAAGKPKSADVARHTQKVATPAGSNTARPPAAAAGGGGPPRHDGAPGPNSGVAASIYQPSSSNRKPKPLAVQPLEEEDLQVVDLISPTTSNASPPDSTTQQHHHQQPPTSTTRSGVAGLAGLGGSFRNSSQTIGGFHGHQQRQSLSGSGVAGGAAMASPALAQVPTIEELVPQYLHQSRDRVLTPTAGGGVGGHRVAGKGTASPSSSVGPSSISTSLGSGAQHSVGGGAAAGLGSRGVTSEIQEVLPHQYSTTAISPSSGKMIITTGSTSNPPPHADDPQGVTRDPTPILHHAQTGVPTQGGAPGENGATPNSLREISTLSGVTPNSYSGSATPYAVDGLSGLTPQVPPSSTTQSHHHQPIATTALAGPASRPLSGPSAVPNRYVDASFSSVSTDSFGTRSAPNSPAAAGTAGSRASGMYTAATAAALGATTSGWGLTNSAMQRSAFGARSTAQQQQQSPQRQSVNDTVITDVDDEEEVETFPQHRPTSTTVSSKSGHTHHQPAANPQQQQHRYHDVNVTSSLASSTGLPPASLDNKYFSYSYHDRQRKEQLGNHGHTQDRHEAEEAEDITVQEVTHQQANHHQQRQHHYQNHDGYRDELEVDHSPLGGDPGLFSNSTSQQHRHAADLSYQRGSVNPSVQNSTAYATPSLTSSTAVLGAGGDGGMMEVSLTAAAKELTYGEIPRVHLQNAGGGGLGTAMATGAHARYQAGPPVERLSATGAPGGGGGGGSAAPVPAAPVAAPSRYVFDPLLGCYFDTSEGKYISKGEHKNLFL